MTPEPPLSRKPSCDSHPPPHAQCANKGKVQPASSAVEAQLEPRRQRSAPPPSGMIAASPTLINPKSEGSDDHPPSSRPLRKKRPPPIQFQFSPATRRANAGSPADPCHAAPTAK